MRLIPVLPYALCKSTLSPLLTRQNRKSHHLIEELARAGCSSVEHLRSDPKLYAMLPPTQRLGLEYVDHVNKPVTRKFGDAMAVNSETSRVLLLALMRLSRPL